MEIGKVGAHAVFEHEAVVSAVVGLAHRRVDAHLGRHAGDDELLDASVLEDGVEVGGVERALARLVDHRFAGFGIKLRNDVVAGLAAHENAAHRAGVADGRRAAAAYLLGRRQIGQIGPMAFARMKRRKAGGAPSRQQATVWLDGPAELRDVVAEHFAEAPWLQKIPLHVDNQQCAMIGAEREGIGFSRDVYCLAHCAPMARRPVTAPDARNMPVASTRTIVMAGAWSGGIKRNCSTPNCSGDAA